MSNAPLSVSFNTSSVKTAIPVIADGTMTRLRLAKIYETEADPEKEIPAKIAFDFQLVDGAPTMEGGSVNPGFPVFVKLPLTTKDSPTATPQWVVDVICRIQDACLGTSDAENKKGKPARPNFDPACAAEMLGKEVVAKVVVVRSKTTDYIGNDLKNFTFPGDVAVG
jgi:hypothetical protein